MQQWPEMRGQIRRRGEGSSGPPGCRSWLSVSELFVRCEGEVSCMTKVAGHVGDWQTATGKRARGQAKHVQ